MPSRSEVKRLKNLRSSPVPTKSTGKGIVPKSTRTEKFMGNAERVPNKTLPKPKASTAAKVGSGMLNVARGANAVAAATAIGTTAYNAGEAFTKKMIAKNKQNMRGSTAHPMQKGPSEAQGKAARAKAQQLTSSYSRNTQSKGMDKPKPAPVSTPAPKSSTPASVKQEAAASSAGWKSQTYTGLGTIQDIQSTQPKSKRWKTPKTNWSY